MKLVMNVVLLLSLKMFPVIFQLLSDFISFALLDLYMTSQSALSKRKRSAIFFFFCNLMKLPYQCIKFRLATNYKYTIQNSRDIKKQFNVFERTSLTVL